MNTYLTKIGFLYKGKVLIFLSSALFGLTLYILYILKPHEINYEEQRISYFFTCLVQSLVPVIVFVLAALLVSVGLKRSGREWNIALEFIFILLVLISVGIGNYLVRDLIYSNDNNWSLDYLKEEVSNALDIGIFIAFIVVLLRVIAELYFNLQSAKKLLDEVKRYKQVSGGSPQTIVQIEAAGKGQGFSLAITEFLYAKSSGNYIDIFLEKEARVQKMTKRMSLYAFYNHFGAQENILRIHKSYVVNLHKVMHVKGNAAGLFLTLSPIADETIPVSRTYLKSFEDGIKKLKE